MNLKRKSNWNLGCSLTLVVVLAAIFSLIYGHKILVSILCNQESRLTLQ